MTHFFLARPSVARRLAATLLSTVVIVAPAVTGRTVSHAAGERVAIWLTTTDDAAGRHVTRGLQQQTSIAFVTDTAAWLMNSSGALSSATRTSVMQRLFDPSAGIGLSFLRNPMGASDLARFDYTYDDVTA